MKRIDEKKENRTLKNNNILSISQRTSKKNQSESQTISSKVYKL